MRRPVMVCGVYRNLVDGSSSSIGKFGRYLLACRDEGFLTTTSAMMRSLYLQLSIGTSLFCTAIAAISRDGRLILVRCSVQCYYFTAIGPF